jgi:methylated-DNA-protein-cysteine methyltransferase related protein
MKTRTPKRFGQAAARGASNTRNTHEAATARTAAIYSAVSAIPRGRVATYGQIAELVGIPAGHRLVARAMRTCPPGLPWQRVVGRKDARRAQINLLDPEHAAQQRQMLEAEHVQFDDNGYIVLRRFGWLPT